MVECDLCEEFVGKKRIHFQSDSDRLTSHLDLHICEECAEWLKKILGVRSRYVNMIKDLKEY